MPNPRGQPRQILLGRGLAIELGFHSYEQVWIKCDNKGAVDLGKNANFSKITKHVCVKHHFIKENIDDKKIEIVRVSTHDMVADPLTKPVPAPKMKEFLEDIGLVLTEDLLPDRA